MRLLARDEDASKIIARLTPYFHAVAEASPEDRWTVVLGMSLLPWEVPDFEPIEVAAAGEPESRLLLSRSTRTICIAATEGDPWTIQVASRLVRVLARLSYYERGALFLHAGAVDCDGAGIAYVGAKRSGKTSSILAMLTSGQADFVSNDDLALRPAGSRWEAIGWPRAVSIRADTLAFALAESGRVRAPIARHPANDTAGQSPDVDPGTTILYPSELRSTFSCGIAPTSDLAAIVMPRFVSDTGVRIRHLPPNGAHTALLECVEWNPNRHEPFLLELFDLPSSDSVERNLADLVQSVPCFTLDQSMKNLREAAEAVRATVLRLPAHKSPTIDRASERMCR